MIAIGLGSLLGPVIGGGLSDVAGFQLTADIVAAISMFFSVLYFFVVFLPQKYHKST
jgi:MFS family permease